MNPFNVDRSFLQADGTPDYLRLILTSRVYDVCHETAVTTAVNLSARVGTNVLMKREDLQPVFSFKLRGAYNMIAHLPQDERWKGVIACSAGNHAQGVAFAAQHLKIPATIVMPTPTPSIKYRNVDRMGANVVLYGDDFDSAKVECERLSELHGLTNIPPFDDPYVIAGQGTIGMEILRQVDLHRLRAIFCAVGGGGLIAGVGAYVKRVAPHVKIIGVETFDADAMAQSLKNGKRVVLNEVGLFADGTAVKVTGSETFRLCESVVDDVVLVNTDEICAAIKDVFEDCRSIVEPSGALALAGVKKYVAELQATEPDLSQDAFVAVLSGANMNFDRLRFVAERAKLGEGSEVFMIATIPETPGSFLALISALDNRSITEFSYRYSDDATAHVYISFSVSDRETELKAITARLEALKIQVIDISDNEFAKSHARYLVGGRSNRPDERVFTFEFPERPGALYKFLHGIKTKWNITLFHYRNHGHDIGKVAAGLEVPKSDWVEFQGFLDRLQYRYEEETENVAYRMFLQ